MTSVGVYIWKAVSSHRYDYPSLTADTTPANSETSNSLKNTTNDRKTYTSPTEHARFQFPLDWNVADVDDPEGGAKSDQIVLTSPSGEVNYV